ncbi:iron ABC transporter permease [Neobacillus novalis]|uniref:Iron ABC transporter permease n=1 Tax=Neobacillus novalis TaxID=220687 RepID=A0AA95MS57_9BACI|nr:iron ABC transporter permease [Neobacillus novalis]WHY86995.1 iron ABC transporter permease [Neobacillus novalis]
MEKIKKSVFLISLIAGPIICIFLSLLLGRYPLDAATVFTVIFHKLGITSASSADMATSIVLDIRLPRALLGALVGASLAASGAAFQGVFRNPLVSSSILGVSPGAGFGAALAILLFNNSFMIYVFAFGFGVLAVFLSYFIGRTYNTTPAVMLVLGGTIVSSVFSALISLVKYWADPYDQLPKITFWLMGSLASASYKDIMIAGAPMLVGIFGLMAIRWRINILSMGDKEAKALGVNLGLLKGILISSATLATAGAVCVSGVIGWVGLIIPHISRMLVGNDNRLLIPTSLSIGACYLVIVDNVSRILTGSEIPLGILTAIIGAPFFVYLLKRKAGGWT